MGKTSLCVVFLHLVFCGCASLSETDQEFESFLSLSDRNRILPDEDDTEYLELDAFFRDSIESLLEKDVEVPATIGIDRFQTRFQQETRLKSLKKILLLFRFLFVRDNSQEVPKAPVLWLWEKLDLGNMQQSRRKIDGANVITGINEKIHITGAENTLTIVLGVGNIVYIDSEKQRVIVAGRRNKVKITEKNSFVYVDGESNKIILYSEGNTVFVGTNSLEGILCVYGRRNNVFVAGKFTKTTFLSSLNFIAVSAAGFKNRISAFCPRNWLWVGGERNKISCNGRRTVCYTGLQTIRNRIYFEDRQNDVVIRGRRNMIVLKEISTRNTVTFEKMSINSKLYVTTNNNNIHNDGIRNDIYIDPETHGNKVTGNPILATESV
ncbi:MAG: uncharacterized protein A8A55_0740 [Amphiamblys sp. WSBS2006]|nr:MAG: uncharacterized protein A8A55_0740 [Amphiamblys sp. WSBS2006]